MLFRVLRIVYRAAVSIGLQSDNIMINNPHEAPHFAGYFGAFREQSDDLLSFARCADAPSVADFS